MQPIIFTKCHKSYSNSATETKTFDNLEARYSKRSLPSNLDGDGIVISGMGCYGPGEIESVTVSQLHHALAWWSCEAVMLSIAFYTS